MIDKGLKPPRRGKKKLQKRVVDPTNIDLYKTKSLFITPDLDFSKIVRESFNISLDTSPDICLSGLHTCGNLSSTCLKVFTSQPDFKILCNIGCCYHLLKEEYSEKEFFGNKDVMDMQKEAGFPMSSYLLRSKTKLGRNARMLAAQSIHRTCAAKELPNISLYYRALLEVLILKNCPHLANTIQVGKVRKFNNFREYIEMCNKKASLSFDSQCDKEIVDLEMKYADQAKFLELFYLIRMTFAPVLESLILLDRLLYLKENFLEQSYIVPLFDSVVSPRNFCIIALKD